MAERKKPAINKRFVITADVVVEYARVSREFLDVEAHRDSLNANIKAAMERGQKCPTDTPYLLVVQPQDRCEHSWKDIAEQIILALPVKARAPAKALVERLQMDKVEVPALKVIPNKRFQARPARRVKNGRWAK